MDGDIKESILLSIKKLLGIPSEYENFDDDVIMYINTAMSMLSQISEFPSNYFITSKENKWSECVRSDNIKHLVEQYIYLKTRILFDPPSNSNLTESIKTTISELEFRISISKEGF